MAILAANTIMSNISSTTFVAADRRTATLAGATPTPPAPPALPDLPDLPVWFIHAFAGTCAFVLVVALVLLLANFPRSIAWLELWWWRRRVGYYQKVLQEDYELDEMLSQKLDEATGSGRETGIRSLGSRKPRNLRIDTGVGRHGLGITVPEDSSLNVPSSGGSVDGHGRGSRPSGRLHKEGWLTAPLPSVSALFHGSPRDHARGPAHSDGDVESGIPCLSKSDDSISRLSNVEVRAPYDSPVGRQHNEHPGTGFLRLVNENLTKAADVLARKFHGQVTGAEEGLLLPVNEGEREINLTDGVFVG